MAAAVAIRAILELQFITLLTGFIPPSRREVKNVAPL